MHGRKRDETPLSAEEKSIKAEKIAKYNAAKAQLLEMRAARQYDAVSYSLSGKLIEINPDFYSLFNYRKEIVQHMWNKDPSSKSAISTAELELSFKALLKNPKCYSAWHHRLWILDHGDASAEEELKLCTKMLKMDARNFHSWNYRRAVAARAGTPAEVEFQYTTEKINENFSNYSAWHYRTVLIPRIYNSEWFRSGSEGIEPRKKEYQQFLDSEFGLVQQAYYTEPSDQSGWLYHRWLLGRVVATGAANQLPVLGISIGTHLFEEKHQQSNIDQRTQEIESSTNSSSSLFTLSSLDWHLTVFTRELQSVSELLEIEPDCKPALLTAAILQAGIIACQQQSGADASNQDELTQLTSNIKEKFDRLIQLDPMRTNYYRDVRQRFIN